MKGFIYAGVLPYAIHKGETYYLLGEEAYGDDKGKWSDFGGRVDPTDASPWEVAQREGDEEGMGLLHYLHPPKKWLSRPSDPHGKKARTFLMEIAYDPSLPRRYAAKRRYLAPHLSEHLKEKSRVKWVKKSELLTYDLRWFFRDLFVRK